MFYCFCLQAALRADPDVTFVGCSPEVGDALGPDVMKSVKRLIPDILARVPILLYQGCATLLSLLQMLFVIIWAAAAPLPMPIPAVRGGSVAVLMSADARLACQPFRPGSFLLLHVVR